MAEGEQSQRDSLPTDINTVHTDTAPEHTDSTTGAKTTEGLTRKLRERGGNRSTVTRSIGELDYAIGTKNANKLKRLKKTLTEKFALLTEMDREILKLVPEDKVESEVEQSDIVQERIEDALMELDEALENLSLTPKRRKSTHHRRHHRERESESSLSSAEQSGEDDRRLHETSRPRSDDQIRSEERRSDVHCETCQSKNRGSLVYIILLLFTGLPGSFCCCRR